MYLIQQLIYSWMRPGYCENVEEYRVSKALLETYIKSVNDFIGCTNTLRINCFVRYHIEVHDDNYVFGTRMMIWHYDQYSNSGHEGTNNGINSSGKVI